MNDESPYFLLSVQHEQDQRSSPLSPEAAWVWPPTSYSQGERMWTFKLQAQVAYRGKSTFWKGRQVLEIRR